GGRRPGRGGRRAACCRPRRHCCPDGAPRDAGLRGIRHRMRGEWLLVIVAAGLELRAGAQLLIEAASFQVAPGDKIGLVGRNGAGKTTLARVLAGEGLPAGGMVRRTGTIGYLPQDSRAGDLAGLAMDRVLSARGLDEVRATMRTAEQPMADPDP